MPQLNIPKGEILFEHNDIIDMTDGLGDWLRRDLDVAYGRGKSKAVLVGVLTGAYRFLADLSRFFAIPHRVGFLHISSH